MTNLRAKVLITEPKYADHVATVASDFPDLELICATEDAIAGVSTVDDVQGLLVLAGKVDSRLLDALPGLRAVVKNGRNYQNVDVEAVRARGLTLACVPRKGPNCVAELAMTLVLALSKDLAVSHAGVIDGAYRYRGMTPELTAERKFAFHWMRNVNVREVTDATLGIIGMGEIGCELARRAEVMGMRILYHKRTPFSPELERRFSAHYRELDALLAESDYVCIALPHTPESDKLIDAAALAKMKPGACLVNIARGGIVDEEALIAALASGQLRGAGLDVFAYEPLPADSPICDLNNVILTPHIGGGSGTTWADELRKALTEVQRVLNGEAPQIDVSVPA
ncbi:MAG: hypothetical protein KDD92_14040 [Caldilineaceae bacterium]|nr:hypothetical protein [Caldilineaceae bacterium]